MKKGGFVGLITPGEGVLPPLAWLSQHLRKWSGNKKYCKVREKSGYFSLSQGKFKSLSQGKVKFQEYTFILFPLLLLISNI